MIHGKSQNININRRLEEVGSSPRGCLRGFQASGEEAAAGVVGTAGDPECGGLRMGGTAASRDQTSRRRMSREGGFLGGSLS